MLLFGVESWGMYWVEPSQEKKMYEYVLGYFTEIFQLVFKRLLNSTLLVNWHFCQSCVPYEFQQSCANKVWNPDQRKDRRTLRKAALGNPCRASWWKSSHLLFLKSEKAGVGVTVGYLIFYLFILPPFHLWPQNWESFVYLTVNGGKRSSSPPVACKSGILAMSQGKEFFKTCMEEWESFQGLNSTLIGLSSESVSRVSIVYGSSIQPNIRLA